MRADFRIWLAHPKPGYIRGRSTRHIVEQFTNQIIKLSDLLAKFPQMNRRCEDSESKLSNRLNGHLSYQQQIVSSRITTNLSEVPQRGSVGVTKGLFIEWMIKIFGLGRTGNEASNLYSEAKTEYWRKIRLQKHFYRYTYQ